MEEIKARRLTTFDVAADGKQFRLNLTDAQGRPAAVTLPFECISELLMTLPRIALHSLRARHNDNSLRVVFPVADWRLERSGDDRLILTVITSDGFEASFLFEADHLRDIANCVDDNQLIDVLAVKAVN